jgi:hypothetical protein
MQEFGFFGELSIVELFPSDLVFLNKYSKNYHGWDYIHSSIFYSKYLEKVDFLFCMGVDAYCVGELQAMLKLVNPDFHFYGGGTRHQSKFRLSRNDWIGFDSSLLNLKSIRQDELSPNVLISASVEACGYVHDEVAYNVKCKKMILNHNLFYKYVGSYFPNRYMLPETILVDFYTDCKPWDISVPGYEVFDKYRSCYNSVAFLFDDFTPLPTSKMDLLHRLSSKDTSFINLTGFRLGLFGKFLYIGFNISKKLWRSASLLNKLRWWH